ncbi:MAG: DegT/DnrJ/EryC1/StrS family aminotransferase [bacterium]|nr:DegT/DnrJ/EryC1/StrS family aminotransferase [bacterium]
MLRLDDQISQLWPELEKAVLDVIRSGHFILGPNVEAFEREAAEFLGVRHAVGVSSGADALIIALRSLGIGLGDEVIVPSFTFFATVEAIALIGATPVFADIQPASFCLDPDSVAAAVTARTRAILPVHLFGHAAEMGPLLQIAEDRNLVVVEDAAQVFAGTYEGRRLGSLGAAAAFSFFPSKNLGAMGDGGLFVTQDDAVSEQARLLRGHGSVRRYVHEAIGYTARLDEIQAAVLRVKLPHVERWNEERRRIAARYSEALSEIPGLTVPSEAADVKHVYHQYTLRVADGRRDALLDTLAELGVSAVIYYPTPCHGFSMFDPPAGGLPETDRAAAEVLSLPIWPEMEDAAVERVIEATRQAMQRIS